MTLDCFVVGFNKMFQGCYCCYFLVCLLSIHSVLFSLIVVLLSVSSSVIRGLIDTRWKS